MKKFLTSIGLMGAVILAALWGSSNWVEARNPDLSYWMQNLSEGPLPAEPGDFHTTPEIQVVGSTVHTMWISRNADWSGYKLYYRRSNDGGRTWEARQLLQNFPAGILDLDYNDTYKRMAVSGSTIHIAVACTAHPAEGWGETLLYFRSTNNGVSFETPRNLYTPGTFRHVEQVYIAATGDRVTIGLLTSYGSSSSYLILNSVDGGVNFPQHPVILVSGSKTYDLQRQGDNNIYVVYANPALGPLYLASSTDNGDTFIHRQISVPSQGGDHKTQPLQYQHYVPKIAPLGNTVSVIWTGKDADDVDCAFYRRSTDNGDTFGDAVNLSRTVLPEGDKTYYGHETLAVKGNYVYTVFLSSNTWRIFLRRSTNGGGSFLAGQELTGPGVAHTDEGFWPLVQTDPNVASGERVHVFWDYPVYCFSTDGGATFTRPALLSPANFSGGAGGAKHPQMAIGPDGRVHYVVDAIFYSPTITCSTDIFHRVFDNPPPAPGARNQALKLISDDVQGPRQRYDNMQVPASSYLNFPGAMTGEVWVKPSPGGLTTGSTSEIKPVFFKYTNNFGNVSYSLCTFKREDKRQAAARIWTTTSGEAWLNPLSETAGLVPDNAWTHLAMTYDPGAGADNFKLFMNGQLIAAGTATGELVTTDGMFFTGYYGNWEVDELRLWNRAMTQTEIAANMGRKLAGTETGLNAYYTFDNTTLDLTGHGNNGYLMYKEEYVNRTTNPVPNIIFPMLLN